MRLLAASQFGSVSKFCVRSAAEVAVVKTQATASAKPRVAIDLIMSFIGVTSFVKRPVRLQYCRIMDDRLERLAEKAKGLPKAPGVYLMKDDKGRVIYVGKSASLRDRVCSYFQPATKLESKKAPLRDVVGDFEGIQTESGVGAAVAGNRVDKGLQPGYNGGLLDEKTFPYLMVAMDGDFSGVYVTREPRTKGVKL